MKKWTKEEEALLSSYVEEGLFYPEIADMLGRTRRSIEKKCERLGISNNKRPKLKTTKQYKEELKNKCPTLECLGEYKRGEIPILHRCLECGEKHLAIPRDKLRGSGHCGYLRNSGSIILNKKAIVYLVYIPKYDLYKVGVTGKSVRERMADNNIREYEPILEIPFNTGKEALELEILWKNNLKDYMVNTGKLKTGNTETFRI